MRKSPMRVAVARGAAAYARKQALHRNGAVLHDIALQRQGDFAGEPETRNIELVNKNLNPTLQVSTILCQMFDNRTKLSADSGAGGSATLWRQSAPDGDSTNSQDC